MQDESVCAYTPVGGVQAQGSFVSRVRWETMLVLCSNLTFFFCDKILENEGCFLVLLELCYHWSQIWYFTELTYGMKIVCYARCFHICSLIQSLHQPWEVFLSSQVYWWGNNTGPERACSRPRWLAAAVPELKHTSVCNGAGSWWLPLCCLSFLWACGRTEKNRIFLSDSNAGWEGYTEKEIGSWSSKLNLHLSICEIVMFVF